MIDVHCHFGSVPNFNFPELSVKKMVSLMDSLGIKKAISSHMAWLLGYRELGYTESLDAYYSSEEKILLYAVFNPGEPESLEFVQKCMKEKAFVGVKIHPSFHKLYADDKLYEPLWKYAFDEQIVILTHSWNNSETNPAQKFSFPGRFEQFVSKYSKAKLILGHSGGRYDGNIVAASLAQKYPNVYLDISGDSLDLGLLKYLVDTAHSEKIMYGSDMNWIDPRAHLGRVYDAKITNEDKENILYNTALNLFGHKLCF